MDFIVGMAMSCIVGPYSSNGKYCVWGVIGGIPAGEPDPRSGRAKPRTGDAWRSKTPNPAPGKSPCADNLASGSRAAFANPDLQTTAHGPGCALKCLQRVLRSAERVGR